MSPTQVLDPTFVQCERNGVDQGVHNVLIHENQVVGATLVSQRDALVANLQAKVAKVDTGHVVRNLKGEAVAVVHQYDRFPNLAAYYYEKYASSIPGAIGDAKVDARVCSQFLFR